MITILLVNLVSIGVSLSPFGRALLVAALLVSAYALVSYWRSLNGRSSKVRYTLVALRAAALVLMSCALAGVRVEYESSARARVLLRSGPGVEVGATGQDSAREQTIAGLRGKGFEVLEADDESVAQEAQGGSFVAGVLLTNGAVSAEEARREVERTSVAAGGAPVYVVANYEESAGPSVALESVTVLGTAVRGVPIAVRCVIHARGMRGRESLVTVSDDAKVQASALIKWANDDERQVVTLTVLPKVAGWIDYSAKVEAAGGENATLLARPFTVYAEELRLRVLFFEGEPTWEAKFIRRALEQAGLFEVDYFAQVSRAAITGMSEEASEQKEAETGAEPERTAAAKQRNAVGGTPEAKLRAALQSAAAINNYDCVIVGASANTLLSAAESARLHEWVERRGGGLVVLGGNSFNGSIIAPGGKLYTLLPTEIGAQSFVSQSQDVPRGRPMEAEKTGGRIQITPTEAGASGALSGYLSAGETGKAVTGALTGEGLRLGQLRPGASVLAVAGQAGPDGTSEAGATLVASMRYGAGRTLVFAPADSWRIRTSGDEEGGAVGAFNALWQGIVMWTAAGARTPALIVLSDESPAEGSTVTAEIRVRDASFMPLKIEKLSARLQPLTEDENDASNSTSQPREISFTPDLSDTNVWRARFPLLARGRFVLEADYTAGGKSANIEKHFAVVAGPSREAGAAQDTLRRTARETGGELIDAGTISLTERLNTIPSNTETVRRTWELRNWWPLAFLIPLLLSTEWFARRWWRED